VRHDGGARPRERDGARAPRQEQRPRAQRGAVPRDSARARPWRRRAAARHLPLHPAGAPHPCGAALAALLDLGRGDGRQRARRGDRQRGRASAAQAAAQARADRHGPAAPGPRARRERARGGGRHHRAARRVRPRRELQPPVAALVRQFLHRRRRARGLRAGDRGPPLGGRAGLRRARHLEHLHDRHAAQRREPRPRRLREGAGLVGRARRARLRRRSHQPRQSRPAGRAVALRALAGAPRARPQAHRRAGDDGQPARPRRRRRGPRRLPSAGPDRSDRLHACRRPQTHGPERRLAGQRPARAAPRTG